MLHLDEAQERIVECLRKYLRRRGRSWRVLLVSDVRARFRIVLWCPKTHRESVAEELERLLAEAGGTYWSGDIVLGQTAEELPDGPWQSRAWDEAGDVGDVRGLRFLERHLSKAGWFDAPTETPWPLSRRKSSGAPICGFYSFKGGVGRSTALAATAVQFAAQGLRVAVVDGDLDSPGVGSLLHGHDGAIAQAGVVDYLIEAPLNEDGEGCRLDDFYHRCPPDLHRGRGEILVFPAGTMDQRYVGKLARLDYGPNVLGNREHPFVSLLRQIRADLAPDWILIDARAGLGEVSGFLTGGLCHLYLVFGSLSRSSWRGLELVIDRLGGERLSRGESQCECLLVAAMVPSAEAERYKRAIAGFTDRARDLFSESYYAEADARDIAWTVDDLTNDSDAPHVPVGLPYDPRLALFADLEEVVESVLLRPDSPYLELASRILRSADQLRGGR